MDPMEKVPKETGKTHVVVEWVQQTGSGGVSGRDYHVKYGNQYLAALAANIGAFAFGAALSWSATALPDMRRDPTFEKLNLRQEALIGSIVALGALLSGPIIGLGVSRYGRRQSMVMLTVPFVLGWLLIYFASNVRFVYIGRLLTGFCGGAFSLAAPIFITEMASTKVRGVLSAGFDVMICAGQLFIFIVGAFLPWRYQALACGVIPLIFHLFMWFVPESPRYLVRKDKRDEALQALTWFRGASEPRYVEDELNRLNRNMQNNAARATTRETRSWRDMFEPASLKPIAIIFFLFVFQELSGIDAILFYTVDIFTASGVRLHSNYCAIIVAAVQLISAMFAASIVDKVGRRMLLLISEFFMMISLGLVGLFFYYKYNRPDIAADYMEWLPVTALSIYVISYSIGLGPITYTIMGELLPEHVKGTAASILTSVKWTVGFVVALFFENIMLSLGRAGGFWLFAGFCLLGVIFVLTCVPETNGETLEEIQQGFAPVDVNAKPENEPFSSSLTRSYGSQ